MAPAIIASGAARRIQYLFSSLDGSGRCARISVADKVRKQIKCFGLLAERAGDVGFPYNSNPGDRLESKGKQHAGWQAR
jgi:hypothetical protein